MKQNVGKIDRYVRAVLGVILLALVLTQTVTAWLAIVLGVLAVILLVTAAIGFCPLYAPFKFSTKKW